MHNPQWNGSGITRLHQSLLPTHRPLLEGLNPWDVKLYNEATQIFWKRWKDSGISADQVVARRILQSAPLLHPKYLDDPIVSRSKLRSNFDQRLTLAPSPRVATIMEQSFYDAMFWNH